MKRRQSKEQYLHCIICNRRRIKPIHRYYLLWQTHYERVDEGIYKVCAWNEVKERCIICKKVLDKGYLQMLAHCIEHYTDKDNLYRNDMYIKVIALNFEITTPAHYEKNLDVKDVITCNICQERFPLYNKNNKLQSHPSKWLYDAIEHYSDYKLIEK